MNFSDSVFLIKRKKENTFFLVREKKKRKYLSDPF